MLLSNTLVQEILIEITDDEQSSIPIIECILNGNTSDEKIAEETQIKLDKVRNILYKLYDAGVASYERSKDPETKWEIYNGKFDLETVTDIISNKYEDLSKEIEKSLKYEENNMFFVCKANNHRYIYEKTSIYNFVCPKCGESLEYKDNTDIIVKLLNKKAAYESIEKPKRLHLSYIN